MKTLCRYLVGLAVALFLPLFSERTVAAAALEHVSLPEDINIAVIGGSLSSLAHLYYLATGLPVSLRSRLAITIFEASDAIIDCQSDEPIGALSTDHLLHQLLIELELSDQKQASSESVGIWNANASLNYERDWTMRFSSRFRESTVKLTSFLAQLVQQYGFSPVLELYRHMSAVQSRLSEMHGSAKTPYASLDELVGRLNLTTPYAAMPLAALFNDSMFLDQFIEPLLRKYGSAREMNALGALALLARDIFTKPGLSFSSLPSRKPLVTALLAMLQLHVRHVQLSLGTPVDKITSIWTLASGPSGESKSRFQIHVKGSHRDAQSPVLYEKLILATPIASLPPFYYLRMRGLSLIHLGIGDEYDPKWKNYKSQFLYERVYSLKVNSSAGLDYEFFQRHRKQASSLGLGRQSSSSAPLIWDRSHHQADSIAIPCTVLASRNGQGLLSVFKRASGMFEVRSTRPLPKTLVSKLFLHSHFKIQSQTSFLVPCSCCRSDHALATCKSKESIPASRFPSLNPAKDTYLLSSMDALFNTRGHIELLLMQAKNTAQLVQQRIMQEQATSMPL